MECEHSTVEYCSACAAWSAFLAKHLPRGEAADGVEDDPSRLGASVRLAVAPRSNVDAQVQLAHRAGSRGWLPVVERMSPCSLQFPTVKRGSPGSICVTGGAGSFGRAFARHVRERPE